MTEPMTPERRAEIEAYVKVLVGVRRTASVAALRDCLAEIDRLNAELAAAVEKIEEMEDDAWNIGVERDLST